MNNNMKKYGFVFVIISLSTLTGCWWGKKEPKQAPKREQQIAMPLKNDQPNSLLSFFEEEIPDFEAAETFVLDEESPNPQAKEITIAHNQLKAEQFNLEEPKNIQQNIKTVYFDYDCWDKINNEKEVIKDIKESVAKWVKKGYKVVFKGHSCKWHGTRAYNLALSGQRAQWIADMCGVPKENIKVFGVGNEEPVIFENTKDGQAPNRRVEIYPIIV